MSAQTDEPKPLDSPESIFVIWLKALTQPWKLSFDRLAASPKAGAWRAFFLIILGVFPVFMAFFMQLPVDPRVGDVANMIFSSIVSFAFAIGIALVFLVSIFIITRLARLFHGRATYSRLAYVSAVLWDPFLLAFTFFYLVLPVDPYFFTLPAYPNVLRYSPMVKLERWFLCALLLFLIYFIVLQVKAFLAVNRYPPAELPRLSEPVAVQG